VRSGTGPPGRQEQKGVLDLEIQKLARSIEQFRVDTLRYLAGDLKIPPEELKIHISARFRRIRQVGVKGVADNFRLNSLEARYNSQMDLYGRKLRERELGGARAPVKKKPKLDPSKGVVVGSSGDNNAVEVLYKGLYLNSGARNPGMDLEKFRSYIDRQAAVVRSKTGCDNIHFRIAVEDGKMKIKAKPVK